MRRTYNEIASTLRKAALGAGFPAGLAEDAGRAGAWLAINGVDGVECVLAGLGDASRSGCNAEGVFENARIAVSGPCALDLALAGDAKHLTLENADAPWMMVGLAGSVASEQRVVFELSYSNGARVVVNASGFELQGELPPGAGGITIKLRIVDGEVREAKTPGKGADIDPQVWAAAVALAAKTYVPATEESRVLGAGAGLTDND